MLALFGGPWRHRTLGAAAAGLLVAGATAAASAAALSDLGLVAVLGVAAW